jgi:hypothetical protein
MFAQGISAFGSQRALVVDGFPIGLDERERLLALPRPVRGIEATALLARTTGSGCAASEDMADGVRGEVETLLAEMSGEALASVAGLLMELQDALLYVGSCLSGLAFGGFGQVVQSCFAALLVALDLLAHELWGGVASSCSFAVVLGVLVGLDDAFACLEGVHAVYLLVGKLHRWRASCFA